MAELLLNAYTPLILWTGIGVLLFRFLPEMLPRLIGRTLYWVGIPVMIFSLARRADFTSDVGLAPAITIGAILLGFGGAWLSLQGIRTLAAQRGSEELPLLGKVIFDRDRQGSFILSSVLGNTGFVGLAIVPNLIADANLSWAILYSVTQNIFGTYGLGVLLASYYGRQSGSYLGLQIRDVLTVPSLWAFTLGYLTRPLPFLPVVEVILQKSIWVVIPTALLLMGMRLSQLEGWRSLQAAILPTLLKTVILPGCIGLITTLAGLRGDPRLTLVLMSGMPTAFAGLILAEEYELNHDLIASSIALSSVVLLLTLPIWLAVFG